MLRRVNMKRTVVLLLTGCQAAAPGLPWLHGMYDTVSSTGISEQNAEDESMDELSADCGVAASRTIELVADVAPSAGRETIIASYRGGISVFDREDHLVAEMPGYRCEGSADELEAIVFGRAYGEPMLAVAATGGGHRESSTWIALFRAGAKLEPVFTGVVEHRIDDVTKRGAIYLLPGALVHQAPGGTSSVWRLDPNARVYVPFLPETPHAEPPLVSRR